MASTHPNSSTAVTLSPYDKVIEDVHIVGIGGCGWGWRCVGGKCDSAIENKIKGRGVRSLAGETRAYDISYRSVPDYYGMPHYHGYTLPSPPHPPPSGT